MDLRSRLLRPLKLATGTGVGRLTVLIAVSWVFTWGGIWLYPSYHYFNLLKFADSDLRRYEIAIAARRFYEAEAIWSTIEYSADRQLVLWTWVERAAWAGPIGLMVTLVVSLGGQWVYRGFIKSKPS